MMALVLAAAALTGQAELAKALEGRVAGAPQRCITLTRVIGTRVVPGAGLIFDAGNTLYLNRTGNPRRLRSNDIPAYRVFGGQLCRGEPVHRLDRSTGAEYGFAILGDFVPYRRAPR